MIIGNTMPWSDEDLNIIKEQGKYLEIKQIIELLSVKRTPKSVQHKLSKLGIHRKQKIIKNYEDIKYKTVDSVLLKLCKKCERYLPSEYNYFPTDNKMIDGIRNVCRECKGECFRVDSNIHKWTEEEIHILKENYPYMTNKELIDKYFNFATSSKIMHKAYKLNLYKTNETLQRCCEEVGKFHSTRLIGTNKWYGKDNPQYNSQRFGELNPNYKGGISALSQELRRNIKQWKLDSMENCNYKCFISDKNFDDIHHLYSFDNILRDTLNETKLPLYENISNYSDIELKQLINKCIEIHYRHPLGICLEEKYHIRFHLEFGYGNNTEEQFYKFLDNYYSGKYKFLEEVG